MSTQKTRERAAAAPLSMPEALIDPPAASAAPTRTPEDMAPEDMAITVKDIAGDALANYDPADYRWVPVRRRPRMDGWTDEKQRRFIETLADTGLVSAAAKAVGMGRESAYRLRRSPHGAAFARAWDAARHHAGGVIEDIAFERAIEGEEHDVFNEFGEVVCQKRTYNTRLLTFLLRHLKPERYGRDSLVSPASTGETPEVSLATSLRDMEPPLPAPPEELLGHDTLASELVLADVADGDLPRHLSEQAPVKTPGQEAAAAVVARAERGRAAAEKRDRGEDLTDREFADECFYIDPTVASERPRRLYR